jgi:hypothetical protein
MSHERVCRVVVGSVAGDRGDPNIRHQLQGEDVSLNLTDFRYAT